MNNQSPEQKRSTLAAGRTSAENKKILYVHGFASSGQSGTVKRMREMFPHSVVIAPDLPIYPHEALALLRDVCASERPDIIIGTSMGGMFTEQLRGYDRILVNPAFRMGDTIAENKMMGRGVFLNPRKNGVQEFYVDEKLRQEYDEVSDKCFQGLTPEDALRVYGLFGTHDTVVHTYDLFKVHYPYAIKFDGEHRLNDRILANVVAPLIRKIDEKQRCNALK